MHNLWLYRYAIIEFVHFASRENVKKIKCSFSVNKAYKHDEQHLKQVRKLVPTVWSLYNAMFWPIGMDVF